MLHETTIMLEKSMKGNGRMSGGLGLQIFQETINGRKLVALMDSRDTHSVISQKTIKSI